MNYEKSRNYWNGVFHVADIAETTVLDEKFIQGLDWFCYNVGSVLDFGCGNGSLVFKCADMGACLLTGIDISEEAIKTAKARSAKDPRRDADIRFKCGGIKELELVGDGIYDAVILSNILDNLYPEDAENVLKQTKRILNGSGKVLIKLNDYLTEAQIAQYGAKKLGNDMLDDGLPLYNITTKKWLELIDKYFFIKSTEEVSFCDGQVVNRMILAEVDPHPEYARFAKNV